MMFLLLTLALLTFSNAQLLDITARSQLAATITANGTVLVAGGVGGLLSSLFGTVNVIDSVALVVKANVDVSLKTNRFALGAATSGNISIFAGGLTGTNEFSNAVDVYDQVADVWTTTNLTVARAYHCVASTGSAVYVAGGQSASNLFTASIEAFDNVNATAVTITATLSSARAYLATASASVSANASLVFFAGGLVDVSGTIQASATVDVLDEATQNITTVVLSQARQQLAVAVAGELVIFAGGASGTQAAPVAVNTVDIWNITANAFVNVTANLSVARWGLKAVVLDQVGLVVFHGGFETATRVSAAVDIYNISSGVWTTATLSRARANFAVAASGTKVFLAGGVSGLGLLTNLLTGEGSLEVLDFSNGTVTPNPPAPSPPTSATFQLFDELDVFARASLAATVVGDNLLVAGGQGLSILGNVSLFSVNTEAVLDLAFDLTVPRYALTAETSLEVNVSAFIGGAALGLVASNNVDVYFAANNSWVTKSLATARTFHASACVGARVFIAGGQGVSGYLDTIEILNLETGLFESTSVKLSQARAYLSATVVGDLVFFAGGRTGTLLTTTFSKVIDVLNTTSLTITSVNLATARAELAVATDGEYVFFAGGATGSILAPQASAVVEIWHVASAQFNTSVSLSAARWGLKAVRVGAEVLFAGGFTGIEVLANVDVWSVVNATFTETKFLNIPRYNFATAVDLEGKAYFVGGATALGFAGSVEIYAGASDDGGNSTDETPTPTPTPTPEVVTPTPTPGGVVPTPTPTPGGVDTCIADCAAAYEDARQVWTRKTSYTVQCGAWDTYFTCLETCTDDSGLSAARDVCNAEPHWSQLCDCAGEGTKPFTPSVVIAFLAEFNDVIIERFNAIIGVFSSDPLTIDQIAIRFSVAFKWDNEEIRSGSPATLDTIREDWTADLAEFFNTKTANFRINNGGKRTVQDASFSAEVVNVPDAPASGVAQISVSFAVLFVAVLFNVLF